MSTYLRVFFSACAAIGAVAVVAAMVFAPAQSAVAFLIFGGVGCAALVAAVAWEMTK